MPYIRRLSRAGDAPGEPTGNWRVQYRDSTGRRHGQTFRTKSAAEAWARDQEHLVRHGRHRDPKRGRLTLGEWHERRDADRVIADSTRVHDAGRWRRYVQPRWGHLPLASIQRMEIQGWVKQLGRQGLAPATVHGIHGMLSGLLSAAVLEGYIGENPCRGVQLPPIGRGREVFCTMHEVALIESQLGPDDAAAVRLLAYTGLRYAEMAGLHVRRLNLLRRRLDVVEVFDTVTRRIRSYPKSQRSFRTLPLPRHVADVLADYLERRPAGPDDLVFRAPRGGPLEHNNWIGRAWRPAVEALTAPGEDGSDPRLLVRPTPHDLRHSYASWLVQDGVPLAEVQLRMGHESIITTMRYAHFASDQYERTLAVLERSPAVLDLPKQDQEVSRF